jgi:hypothetical protein
MCSSVQLHGREYQMPAELAELVGGAENLVWQPTNPFVGWPEGKDWHIMDGCLCPIDLAVTLGRVGFKWTRGPDPMEWFVVENSGQRLDESMDQRS